MEDNIKSLNISQTIIANIVNIIFIILSVRCFFWGIKIVESFNIIEMKLFGFFGFIIIFMTKLHFKFVIVYDSKDGGYIRFDGIKDIFSI